MTHTTPSHGIHKGFFLPQRNRRPPLPSLTFFFLFKTWGMKGDHGDHGDQADQATI